MIGPLNMKEILSREYLNSDIYSSLMMKYVTEDNNLFRQEENVENWVWRLSNFKTLGAWRWLATFRHKELIMDYIFSDKFGIDFGGHNGPIWGNTEIIDIEPKN